jgi:replicative DNA helicase
MDLLPPNNLDAEMELLGAFILEPEILSRCSVSPEYFYRDRHRSAFIAMQSLHDRGEDVTALTVFEAMKGAVPASEIVSWAKDFAQIPGRWKANQKVIIDAWKMRRLLNLGQSLIAGVANRDEFDELSGGALDTLQAIAAGTDIEIVRYHDIVAAGYKAVEDRHGKGEISGVPTGIELLDDMTDGLQEDEFTLVASRPGIGKTSFGQGMLHHAGRLGINCGLINLEMSNKQLGLRALASYSRIPITLLRKAAIQESDWSRLAVAAGSLAELPIFVADAAFDDRKIYQVVYRMVHEKKCRLIVLDYLQLMESTGDKKYQSREREVASFSRMLKKTAKALHVPIVALAQINRASETTKDKKPGIHNLRESGALEADADRILLLHVPECSCGEALECRCGNRNALEVIIGKGRNDPKGSIMVEWYGATTSFGRSYRPGELPPQYRSGEKERYAD